MPKGKRTSASCFCNPWRHIKVADQRIKQDFAWCMQDLVDFHFQQAEKLRVVLDKLNTHRWRPFMRRFRPTKHDN